MSDDEEERTIWCGNLSEKVTHDVLYELFYQAGPLDKVRIPRSADGLQRNFGFVTYTHKESVSYAIDLFRGTYLYDRELRMQMRKNGRGNCTPSSDVAMLLGRPLGATNVDSNIEQKFITMTNQMIISGGFNNFDDYEAADPSSNNGQSQPWVSRYNSRSDREKRRNEPYRRGDRNDERTGRDWDRNRRDRDRGGDRWGSSNRSRRY